MSADLPPRPLRRRHRARRRRRPAGRGEGGLRPARREAEDRRKPGRHAPSRFRARRRPLHPADPDLARRGVPAGAAPGRAVAGRSTRPSRSIPSTIPTRPSGEALLHPLGDSTPLPELLFAGMRLTIAFDDISLPLPPMHRPDNRQRVIEAVLDMAAAAGVDDVVLICALALHRRMTEAELRHAIGDRVYDAFAPHGLLLQHDAEDPDGLVYLGQTDHGRGRGDQQAGGRVRPARLRQHQPGRHGRRPQERRHRSGQLPQPAPPSQRHGPCATPARLWTRSAPSCTRPTGAWAG